MMIIVNRTKEREIRRAIQTLQYKIINCRSSFVSFADEETGGKRKIIHETSHNAIMYNRAQCTWP